MTGIESRTVDWWSVHIHVKPLLEEVGCWPMVGTLPWQALPTNDPLKMAAIYDAARHWALRVDTSQAALADASRAVAAATDWTRVANQIRQRNSSAYIPRRTA